MNVVIATAEGSFGDPATLYAALSNRGKRADTMMFEAAGTALILDAAAVRIECRNPVVSLVALTRNGRRLIEHLGEMFATRVVHAGIDRLHLRFPRSNSADSKERLATPSAFDVVRAVTMLLNLSNADDPFAATALGIIAFDCVDLFEDLPSNAEDPLDSPDFLFWVPESLIVLEPRKAARAICIEFGGLPARRQERKAAAGKRLATFVRRCADAAALPGHDGTAAPSKAPATVDIDDRAFADLVLQLKQHIAAGDVYQIVASRTFSAPCDDAYAAFERLRTVEPSPYSYFVSSSDFQLLGASPETSVKVFDDEGLTVELKPIAGTRPRGSHADEDDRLEAELRLDPKEPAEHIMLVDLARNDVARVSEPGTRRVTEMMKVERYARVMHLVSRVAGKLKAGFDAVDALKACLNMGTLSGAPKIRATQLLREAERTKRGPYGGAIGWLNGEGHCDTAIVIRTAIVKDGIAQVRAGAGIVHDSDPSSEADETRRKASALLSVLTDATQ